MQKKQVSIIPKSMQQDLAVSQFPADAAYKLINMRVVSTGDNTSLCLTNEKSNLDVNLELEGTVLGLQVLKTAYIDGENTIIKDCAIVFSKNKSTDNIGRIFIDDEGTLRYENLFEGNLNFSVNAPIESVGIYETDSVQKVYWVDGINQPRVINVSVEGVKRISPTDNTQFDFMPDIQQENKNVIVNIKKVKKTNSLLPSGVIQYALSYFNKYGQQTGLIYQSPLVYSSGNNRGLDAESNSSDAFEITMSGLNSNFEYVRVYRILRTSIDATVSAEIVGDYKINDFYSVKTEEVINSTDTNKGKIAYLQYDLKSNSTLNSLFYTENESRLITETDYPNVIIIDQRPSSGGTTQDFKIYYTENDFTYIYTIPKDYSIWLEWTYAATKGDLSKEYKVGVATYKDRWVKDNSYIIQGIQENGGVITDTGTTGSTIDPTELLFLGGEPIHPNTIAFKDNTLFLGNFNLEKKAITTTIKENIKKHSIVRFKYLSTNNPDSVEGLSTQYLYKYNLDKSSKDITFFQKGETYRVGIQCLHKSGSWSEVIFLGDFENNLRVIPNKYNDDISQKPVLEIIVDTPDLQKDGYVAMRPVCVFPTIADRSVLCQGITLPTVYNIKDRVDNAPYAQSSWFARPSYAINYMYGTLVTKENMEQYRKNLKGFPLEYRMSKSDGLVSIPAPDTYNAEIQYGKSVNSSTGNRPYQIDYTSDTATRIDKANTYVNNFGIDKTIVTFHSPELDTNYDDTIFNIPLEDIKFRVIGYVPLKTTLSDLKVEAENPFNPTIGKFYWSQIKDPSSTSHLSGFSLPSFPFWVDSIAIKEGAYQPEALNNYYWYASFPIYPWNKAGSLNNQGSVGDPNNRKSTLKSKTMSNLRIGLSTRYLPDVVINLPISNIELFNSDNIELKKLKVWGKEVTYYGNIDKVLVPTGATTEPLFLGSRISSTSNSSITSSSGTVTPPKELIKSYGRGYYENIATIGTGAMVDRENAYATNDALPIKYKSTSHAVFAFEKDYQGYYTLLPSFTPISYNVIATALDGINVTAKFKNIVDYNPQSNGLCLDWQKPTQPDNLQLSCTDGWKITSITPYILTVDFEAARTLYINNKQIINAYSDGDSLSHSVYGYYADYKTEKLSSISISIHTPEGLNKQFLYLSRLDVWVYNEITTDTKVITFNFINSYEINPTDVIIEEKEGTATTNVGMFPIGTSVEATESYDNPIGLDEGITNLLWENADEVFEGFKQKSIPIKDASLANVTDNYFDLFYFVVGELYRDKVINRFGGDSETAIVNNIWIPCGETVYFQEDDSITLIGDQGDTYYQRYDHLKTYPYTSEDINKVVDIASFCCETRINIDGRYDRNRGLQSNTHITPNNFNLYNKVYSQRNNFFTYKALNSDDFPYNTFPSQITWSKSKVYGEDVDTWTNITMANILDLDGDKGELQALRKFGNEIYAFQDSGISKILYNNRVQINPSDGVPIEIANSDKVQGKVYLSSKYGCQDKWSITETPSGLYFVDNINQGILAFNGENITDITYTKNMYSWISKNSFLGNWVPNRIITSNSPSAIRTLYDRNNGDIYFTTCTEALAFSERLGAFSSFYDYNNVDWLFNLGDNTYQIRNSKLWKLHGGEDYGIFFGENKGYSLAVIANPEFQLDKVFDTVEFRTNGIEHFTNWEADSYPFNSLVTTNEYQTAVSTTSSLKKKFRTWRWQVGRNNTFGKFKRDRIRNPWAKITMSGNSDKEMRLYDIVVTYYT